MRTEIRNGESCQLGSESVELVGLRSISLATPEGEVVPRAVAVVSIGGNSIEVHEGSRLQAGGSDWVVVKISTKKDLVRLREVGAVPARFQATVEGFQNSGSATAPGMMFTVQAVRLIDGAVSRLDDHPDTIGAVTDDLQKAQRYLDQAHKLLSGVGASAALLGYVERYQALCGPLVEAVMTATQERDG